MCTLDELKEANNKEHNEIRQAVAVLAEKVKSAVRYANWHKWIVGGLLLFISVILTMNVRYQNRMYDETLKRSEEQIKYYKQIDDLKEAIDKQSDFLKKLHDVEVIPNHIWVKAIYDTVVIPNKNRSVKNEKEIARIKSKLQ